MLTSASTSSSQRQPQTHKHVVQLLVEKRAGDLRADNLSRRLSALTIWHHERYMQLLQKRIHAQRVHRGTVSYMHSYIVRMY